MGSSVCERGELKARETLKVPSMQRDWGGILETWSILALKNTLTAI